MEWMQSLATHVPPAAPTGVEPNRVEIAEVDPKQPDDANMDAEDPFTGDDEENERREANKKDEEVLDSVKIRRSVNVAKKAKGKVAGVKSTIGSKKEYAKQT